MKATTVGLALAFCSLFLAGRADAQGGCQVTPHYSNYVTQSLDSSLNIIQTVTMDGYGTMNLEFCLEAENAQHTPHGSNEIIEPNGTVHGGAFSGAPVCAVNCNIYAQNTITFQGATGVDYTEDVTGSVSCSVAGVFFFFPPIVYDVHIGITNFNYSHNDGVNCYYSQYCPTGSPSCPAPTGLFYPDGMLDIPPCNLIPYAATYHLVVNYQCFPIGVTSFHSYSVPCQ